MMYIVSTTGIILFILVTKSNCYSYGKQYFKSIGFKKWSTGEVLQHGIQGEYSS